MSSHILEDIERVCDYVIILDQGHLVVSQPIRGIGMDISGELIVQIDGDPQPFIERLTNASLTVSRAERRHIWDEFVISYDNESAFDLIRDVAAETDVAIRLLRTRSRSLQDLYFSRVGNVEGIETGVVDLAGAARRAGV
jgi:ABC-2 type transport system ATP-binding protein